MALDVLTLRIGDGRHALSCPVGAVVDLGRDPTCEIVLEGDGVLPHHCMLQRMDERHFRVTAIATSARFTVNDVVAADLGVDVPFKFGIDGEVIEFDVAAGEALAAETSTIGHDCDEASAESRSMTSTGRATRRGYLLQSGALKLRTSHRLAEPRLSTAELPPVAVVQGEARPAEDSPITPSSPTVMPLEQEVSAPLADVGSASPHHHDEESSSLLLGGLLVCAAMIAGIFWWQQELDAAETLPSTPVARRGETLGSTALPQSEPSSASAEAVAAGRALRLAGASFLAVQLLSAAAEGGDREALEEAAAALHDSGARGAKSLMLLQAAAEGGSRQAWEDLVAAIDRVDYPQRFNASSFLLLQRAAALGIASAWMPLGERFEHGQGTAPDMTQALLAFEQAHIAGDKRAAAKLSAKEAALQRVEAFVRSWNEVSVASLFEHVSATPVRLFSQEHPGMESLLHSEEELRTRWPLRRIRVKPGAQAKVEKPDCITVTQPFQFEVENGQRLAAGTGVLVCAVQRDAAGIWRVMEAVDTIQITELKPGADKFISAGSLRELKPALSQEERAEEARQTVLREMRDIDQTQDFETALAAVLRAAREFPQAPWWRPQADILCDRMARQLFAEGRWLDATWGRQVHELAEAGSTSALLLEGHLLAAGYSCQRDEARSTALYQKAFETSQRRDARFYYAEALFQGRGVPQDLPKAGALVLALMTRSKHPLEAYLAAHLLWRKAEKNPALWQDVYDTLTRVADKHPPAKHLAAMVLLNHGNTTRERRTGFAALKAAAEAGVQEAMKNLSKCYQDGTGCEEDFQAATLWKQKAAITEPPRRKHYTEFED